MPTITIRIDLPEGATVSIEEGPAGTAIPEAGTLETPSSGDVERYWRSYLSDNGRELYRAAAAIEHESGPGYTLNHIADRIGREYSSAQSIHRTTGRSARKWHDDTGTDAPIQLEWLDYAWSDAEGGMRTSYQLPEGVADRIAGF
jgi:hypothetical protein